jgi:hypothetical protein
MSESPYAVPEDELVGSARVPVAEQVEIHSEPRPDTSIWTGPNPYGDQCGSDTDGD